MQLMKDVQLHHIMINAARDCNSLIGQHPSLRLSDTTDARYSASAFMTTAAALRR